MKFNQTMLTMSLASILVATTVGASANTSQTSAPVKPNPAVTTQNNDSTASAGQNTTLPSTSNTSFGTQGDSNHEQSGCVLEEARDEAQAAMTEIVINAPKRTDIMKNLQENESTKGCLASTKEILDLAATLPTIRGSWGSIGSIIRNRAEAEIAQIKNKAIDRACAVADQAIADVMSPIKNTVRRINDFSDLISNAPEVIAGQGVAVVGKLGSRTSSVLDREFGKAQERVNAETSKIVSSLSQGPSVLDNAAMELGFENISDAAEYGRNIQVSNAMIVLQNLQSKIPPKPQYTVTYSKDDGYKRCASSQCQNISVTEYTRIQKQWSDYNVAVNEFGPQIEAARIMYQDALKEVNSNTGLGSNSNTRSMANNASVASSTANVTNTVNDLANQGRNSNINLNLPSAKSTASTSSATNETRQTVSPTTSTQPSNSNAAQAPKAPNPFGG